MTNLEVWQRGPIDGIPTLLQPVTHAILQAAEELEMKLLDFPDNQLWTQPVNVASVGFHLQHMTGVIDRLFTYARGESLTEDQMRNLLQEESRSDVSTAHLVHAFRRQVEVALDQLRITTPESLAEPRGVGRKRIPTTVLGLLFHAAEHTQRHLGQLIVTARVVKSDPESRTV